MTTSDNVCKKKQKITLLYDYFPAKNGGGLVSACRSLISMLSNDWDIQIVSVLNSTISEFEGTPVINLSGFSPDMDYKSIKSLLLHKQWKKAGKIFLTILYYLTMTGIGKRKTKPFLQDGIVIAQSPAAACFIDKDIPFLLEIHSSFDYFFSGSMIGRAQTKRMSRPQLTLFRTKTDARKAEALFPSDFIYNSSELQQPCLETRRWQGRLLFAGRLEKEKQPLKAIQIAEELKNKGYPVHLDVYGKGILENDLQAYITDHHLEDTVVLKGFSEDKSFYKNYDLLVVTSDYEGFSLVTLEAKCYGVPAVSLNWGDGASEIICHEKNGFVADNLDQLMQYIEKLIRNPAMYADFCEAAYKDYSRFSKEAAKTKWICVLERFWQREM